MERREGGRITERHDAVGGLRCHVRAGGRAREPVRPIELRQRYVPDGLAGHDERVRLRPVLTLRADRVDMPLRMRDERDPRFIPPIERAFGANGKGLGVEHEDLTARLAERPDRVARPGDRAAIRPAIVPRERAPLERYARLEARRHTLAVRRQRDVDRPRRRGERKGALRGKRPVEENDLLLVQDGDRRARDDDAEDPHLVQSYPNRSRR